MCLRILDHNGIVGAYITFPMNLAAGNFVAIKKRLRALPKKVSSLVDRL